MEVARTFLHEAVHAKIFSDLRTIHGYQNLSADNFPVLWATYVEARKGGKTMTEAQGIAHHEEMANHYVELIAKGLKEWDVINQNNPDITIDHYRAMAWDGLRKTSYWENILTQEEKQGIDAKYFQMLPLTLLSCND